MRHLPQTGPARARRRVLFALLVLLVILAMPQISNAQDTTEATDAATTDAATTTASETTGTTTDSSSTTESTTSSTSSSTTTPIPTVTVPPTAGAPYMQTSSTPEGTVFIAVGAVLGFLGLAVLAWRGLVAWSVNRSVKQAAMVQSSETKGLLRASSRKRRRRSFSRAQPNLPHGIGGGAAGGHHRRTSSHGHGTPNMTKVTSSSSNGLFFSPTAGATRHAHGHAYGQNGPAKRASYSHPSPYYGTGTSTPVSGPTPGPAAAQWQPPYRPRAHSQQLNPNINLSPSSSPILYPYPYSHQQPHQYTGGIYDPRHHPSNSTSRPLSSDNTSNSSLNLATPPQGRRAPSEYLEDLFESHGQAPPPAGPGDWWGRA